MAIITFRKSTDVKLSSSLGLDIILAKVFNKGPKIPKTLFTTFLFLVSAALRRHLLIFLP